MKYVGIFLYKIQNYKAHPRNLFKLLVQVVKEISHQLFLKVKLITVCN